jgi:hypothetical protein
VVVAARPEDVRRPEGVQGTQEDRMSYPLPVEWMRRICSGSVPAVLALYADQATLVPTFAKSDLPGAGLGVLQGRQQLAPYFQRFLSKQQLCGTVDTLVAQRFGNVRIYSGLYTFSWREGARRQSANARYTFVTVGPLIVSHHSSAVPQ